MDFYNKFFSKADENKRKELVNRLQQSATILEKEILKIGTISEHSDALQLFIETFIETLEDGLKNSNKLESHNNKRHLWNIISSQLVVNSIKSINASTQPGNEARKLSLWILIELDSKTLASSFEKMAQDWEILQNYLETSALKKSAGELRQILERLMRSGFELQSDTIKSHHKARSDTGVKTEPQAESDSQGPGNHGAKNIDEIKGNLDRYRKLLQKTQNSAQNQEKESYIREDYQKFLEEKQERKPLHVLRKILVPDVSFLKLKTSKSKPKLRKTSSFGDLDEKKIGGDNTKLGGNEEHSATHPTHKQNMSVSGLAESDENGGSVIHEESNHSVRSDPKVMFTADDYDMFGEKLNTPDLSRKTSALRTHSVIGDLGITKRSEVLFRQKYRAIQQEYEYRDPPSKIVKPEDQNYKCFSCQAPLNKILLMVWKKNAFCHYTGYWYCSDCMSEEKLYIPWYIESNFDFKKYHVCKKARDELHNFYAKPNMFIDSKSSVVQKNKIFYETLVLKRELHLIFDMICEGLYLLDLLGQHSNLLLKMNLLSVKNLVEIESGAMKQYIEKSLNMMISHIEGCNLCQKKGKVCPGCGDKKKIFPYDIGNTSICRNCKSLYHTKCLKRRDCIVCQHNS